MEKKKNVVLIGMPGAGKTCMGKAISKKMNMKVIDGDRLIEEITGRKLQNIIDEDGLEAFKQIERETKQLLDDKKKGEEAVAARKANITTWIADINTIIDTADKIRTDALA